MKKIIILSIFLLTLLITNNVNACSVGPDWSFEPQFQFDKSDNVFVGTITEVDKVGDINGNFLINFDVEKTYKGNVANTVEVTTGANSAMCGYDDIDTFQKGDIWSIYASSDLYTTSITANTKHDSVESAVNSLDDVLIENVVFCPLNYDPVCGRKDTGIRCITTPCDSTEDITYGNSCQLGADNAEFLYEGECRVETIPNNCKSWFDGCNNCFRDSVGSPVVCTERACIEKEESVCNEYFVENIEEEIVDDTVIPDIDYVEVKENKEKGFWRKVYDLIIKALKFEF